MSALDFAALVPTPTGPLASVSGSITSGGTAQVAMTAQLTRRYLLLLNPPSATENLWFNLTGTAVINGEATGSIALAPGQSFTAEGALIPVSAVSVIAATTGHKYTIYVG